MIRTESEMRQLTERILSNVETEIVEYKEAKRKFGFDELGRYFSALSNEANLRNAECGWLFFGVTNDRTFCGTAYRQEEGPRSTGLQKLKHEISQKTNSGMTFEEIYEYEMDGKRVIAFQIPAGTFAVPTTWEGVPWSRENESLVQMPDFKLQAIYVRAVLTGPGKLRMRPISPIWMRVLPSSRAANTSPSSPRANPPLKASRMETC